MFGLLLATGVCSVPPVALAPQLDFASIPPLERRAPRLSVEIEVRLTSGEVRETGTTVGRQDPQYVCDKMAGWFGSQVWNYRQEGLKLTLFAVEGERIVSIRARLKGPEELGGIVCPLAVRWVPRVPPKPNWVFLGPAPHTGAPLARMASSLYAGTVAGVAAPELDFSVIPKDCKELRVLHLWVYARLASGKVEIIHSSSRDPSRMPFDVRAAAIDDFNRWFAMRLADSGGVALLEYLERPGDGQVISDPVVGLYIESNGPVPALRWTWRPGIRDLFRGK